MSNQVRIEIMDQFGKWHRYTSVSNSPSSIKQALQAALKQQLASRSKKVRAVDDKTNNLIDMLQG
jgi:hypothetical protein|tara:strand:- start:454 stop:648 length:195 start_codon:yes stop_codon:yes gene_type:complete